MGWKLRLWAILWSLPMVNSQLCSPREQGNTQESPHSGKVMKGEMPRRERFHFSKPSKTWRTALQKHSSLGHKMSPYGWYPLTIILLQGNRCSKEKSWLTMAAWKAIHCICSKWSWDVLNNNQWLKPESRRTLVHFLRCLQQMPRWAIHSPGSEESFPLL